MKHISIKEIQNIQIIGLGLIGTSIGFALKKNGYAVTGYDIDPERTITANEIGAIDTVGLNLSADVTFIAVPVAKIVPIAKIILMQDIAYDDAFASLIEQRDAAKGDLNPQMILTDVAGIKAPIVAEIDHPYFIGGHPMAGSERLGPLGADPKLFVGASWVLTPTGSTNQDAFTALSALIRQMDAEVVSLEPDRHDRLVATVSHVPHLIAANLMLLAQEQSFTEAALLRLAAGGFRDMTRISAGDPEIWPDVLLNNGEEVMATLESLVERLDAVRLLIAERNRSDLYDLLQRAQKARRNLPQRALASDELVEVAIMIPDKPGVLAEITTCLGSEGINLYNLEIVHSGEFANGILIMVIDRTDVTRTENLLSAKGYALNIKESYDR